MDFAIFSHVCRRKGAGHAPGEEKEDNETRDTTDMELDLPVLPSIVSELEGKMHAGVAEFKQNAELQLKDFMDLKAKEVTNVVKKFYQECNEKFTEWQECEKKQIGELKDKMIRETFQAKLDFNKKANKQMKEDLFNVTERVGEASEDLKEKLKQMKNKALKSVEDEVNKEIQSMKEALTSHVKGIHEIFLSAQKESIESEAKNYMQECMQGVKVKFFQKKVETLLNMVLNARCELVTGVEMTSNLEDMIHKNNRERAEEQEKLMSTLSDTNMLSTALAVCNKTVEEIRVGKAQIRSEGDTQQKKLQDEAFEQLSTVAKDMFKVPQMSGPMPEVASNQLDIKLHGIEKDLENKPKFFEESKEKLEKDHKEEMVDYSVKIGQALEEKKELTEE